MNNQTNNETNPTRLPGGWRIERDEPIPDLNVKIRIFKQAGSTAADQAKRYLNDPRVVLWQPVNEYEFAQALREKKEAEQRANLPVTEDRLRRAVELLNEKSVIRGAEPKVWTRIRDFLAEIEEM